MITLHEIRCELRIVVDVALVPLKVELATVTSLKFTLLKVIGAVVVELIIVEVPVIPSADDEATEGK